MIKSELINNKKQDIKYPCLMQSLLDNRKIVLMIKYRNGFVVNQIDDSHPIGYFNDRWDMSLFIKYTGEVILKND